MKPTFSAMKLRLLAIRSGPSAWSSGPPPALLLMTVAALFSAGCRTPSGQILLERENFQQEKRIEDLKDQVEDAEQDLAQCRRENAALKKQLGGAGLAIPSSNSPLILTPPDVAPPTTPPPNIPLFQPPKIDRGTESPPDDAPALPSGPGKNSLAPPNKSQPEQWVPPKAAPPLEKPDRLSPDSGATTSSYQEEDASSAVRITVIRLLTNGHQFGGHTSDGFTNVDDLGDNGLQVTFSARDAANRPVAVDGSIAMVVVDPLISARVARWDYSSEEAKAHYHQTLFGKAYRFSLLWPHGAPQHERLKLFVRVTTPDGQRLEAEQAIHVRLGTLLPAPDDSDFADSPAPPDREPSRSEPLKTAPAVETAMGEYEPDEPAPHGAEPSAATIKNGMAHNGAVWKPYR